MFRDDGIEISKDYIQQGDDLHGCALRTHGREADNVREQHRRRQVHLGRHAVASLELSRNSRWHHLQAILCRID